MTPRDRFAPVFISRVFFVGVTLLVLDTFFRHTPWVRLLLSLYSTLLVPVDGSGLGAAAFLLVLGVGLMRRKRLAWWIAVGYLGLLWLATAVALIGVAALHLPSFDRPERHDIETIPELVLSAVALGGLLVVLIVRRRDFSARSARGNLRKAGLVLAVGLVTSVLIGWVLTWLSGGQGRPRSRLLALLSRMATGSTPQGAIPPPWVATIVGALIAASFFLALQTLLRSQRSRATLALDDEIAIRQLLARHGGDSLSYFATRRDKQAVFSPDRSAAIAYRVEVGVCLASGDPIGAVEHWPAVMKAFVEEARTFGWTPAVVGASSTAAQRWEEAGMRIIRVGDEAVLTPSTFDLESRELRGVRQAAHHLQREGWTVRVRRHSQIPSSELGQLSDLADQWRVGGEERGFSMALGRLGDDLDGDCLMVEALAPAASGGSARTMGLLSFVPWGRDGVSLDLMRRSPQAENGVNELMVVGLMHQARDQDIARVSLNFAVFRTAFEEGVQLGATPVQRFKRRMLLVASRWFQLEQLYRSNVKYSPTWSPRYLAVEDTVDLGTVGLALGIAEGYVDAPRILRPLPLPAQPRIRLSEHPGLAAALEPPAPELPQVRVSDQVSHRMRTRAGLLDRGVEPYPASFVPDAATTAVVLANRGAHVTVAGRVLAIRDHGGVVFIRLQDWYGEAQVLLDRGRLGPERLRELVAVVSLGDHVGFSGEVAPSKRGTPSLHADSWTLTAKALRPLPDKYSGISDAETRVRQRYLDLITNQAARDQLRARSHALRAVRETLQNRGYLEVETPILQTIHGGANARPFRTHINAYDLELYLRIAPELFLKRLMVGGVDRVFEIGRNFRNEGADATHNPEFTMLEAYQAYGDYTVMRGLAEEIIVQAALAANGHTIVRGTDHHGVRREVDLSQPWRVMTVNDALSMAIGETVTADTTQRELVSLADRLDIPTAPSWTRGEVVLELYEHLVEHKTVAPTFYCDFPADVSPLTRGHREDDRLAERWDLVAFGAEIGTAYSELVDPVVQRQRLTAQSLLAAGGNPEAMELDEDFLTALEYAMPPSGGLGMGMDRLVMMLTDTSIRETIAFPLVRPRSRVGD
ncbi:bifunctional lysylphosphatidylglycerol synthetase/lysine--tRNA ligase LysX [Aestuariimicrobium kwangyangense]|uniref:bifunctional lysylphosphatidylglycerol synthetase/lysine--tRNA ligase LysX n=1 Tax=Aestuariimicrobium kwangyangense TaxID=396389 RepID=UPI0003B71D4A|nr:bifunctional lysylphosphatidylglycerol synthetase/lysine--tRNA ligase LysX [Aestuariimicrobium kwangyangense]